MSDPSIQLSIIIPLAPGHRPEPGLTALAHGRDDVETIISAGDPAAAGTPGQVHWITGSAGRGVQLNRGARHARGRWLWFVHADCRPETGALAAVIRFVADDDEAIGYCRLRFRNDGPRLARLNAVGANLRSRAFGMPYGDQGLCVPAAAFARLGGFREDLERGEDLDFVVRARRAGLAVRPMGTRLETSARRYRDRGWLKTTLEHQIAAIRLIRGAKRNRPSEGP